MRSEACPGDADWRTVLRELLEVVEARNSQGGGLTLNAEGQRRVDAAKALLATGCGLCTGTGVADLPDPWGGVRGTCPDCHGSGHAVDAPGGVHIGAGAIQDVSSGCGSQVLDAQEESATNSRCDGDSFKKRIGDVTATVAVS